MQYEVTGRWTGWLDRPYALYTCAIMIYNTDYQIDTMKFRWDIIVDWGTDCFSFTSNSRSWSESSLLWWPCAWHMCTCAGRGGGVWYGTPWSCLALHDIRVMSSWHKSDIIIKIERRETEWEKQCKSWCFFVVVVVEEVKWKERKLKQRKEKKRRGRGEGKKEWYLAPTSVGTIQCFLHDVVGILVLQQ